MAISLTAAIHSALTQHSGDREKAAEQLGMTREQLNEYVRTNKDLNLLWSQTLAATVIEIDETIDRDAKPPAPPPTPTGEISPRDEAVANAHLDQAQKLERFDWEGIGIRDRETIDLMRAFEANAGRGVLRMMDTMQGGMAYAFARVSRRFAELDNRLVELRKNVVSSREKENLMTESFLHEMWMATAKEMQKFNAEAVKASHMRLLIAHRAGTMKKAAEKLRRGGWEHARKVNGATDGKRTATAA